MAKPEGITKAAFRVLVERAGLALRDDEVVALKPMYEFYAARLAVLHDMALEAEDMAVAFPPEWAPGAEVIR